MPNKSRKYILWLKEVSKKNVPLVGGKNASLGEMINSLVSKGINIPNGFATTAQAYFDFLDKNNLRKRIKTILKEVKVTNLKDVQKKGREVRNLILKAELPEELARDIKKAYRKLSREYGQGKVDVAVRSSATAEDLPSIAGNEMVFVRMGNEIKYIEIEKLFQELKYVSNPIFTPSLTNNGEIKWVRVKEIYRHPAENKTLYKITTKSGREITITPDHSLITLEPDEFESKVTSINKLDKTARLPVIKRLPLIGSGSPMINVEATIKSKPIIIENGRVKINQQNTLKEQYGLPVKISINKEFAYFLGIYLAEGSIYEKRNCIDISCDSNSVLNRVRKFYKSIGSYNNQKVKYQRKVRVQNVVLTAFLNDITGNPLPIKGKGRSARAKRIPDFIFGQPQDIICEFLKGLFDGDGWVDRSSRIGYVSLSKKLIGGIAKLLEMIDINYYLNKRGIEITIPASQAEKFKKLINFTEKEKQKKLEKLIKNYQKIKKHQNFIDTLPPSKKISQLLERKLKPQIKLEKVLITICPKCGGEMIGGGFYRDYKNPSLRVRRYYCENCSFSPGERTNHSVIKKMGLKYKNYDSSGRFVKGMQPWNKGNRRKLITYGVPYLKKIAEKINSRELLKIVNSDIIWDKIDKIEPIKYSGFVYDFVVPKTQNFAAGVGGVITHNTASFAGQQETYLNITGEEELLLAVKKCFASLFTDRAIVYREEMKFDHLKIALSVGVQKMVRSDLGASGVMFSCDTETGFPDVVLINAGYGLGENVVKGKVDPDQYYVFETTLKKGFQPILERKLGSKKLKLIYSKDPKNPTRNVKVPLKDQEKFVLSDKEILTLAKWSILIEEHYKRAMDTEWAKDGKSGKLYIVQARPETVQSRKDVNFLEEYVLDKRKARKLLVSGLSVGNKIGQGRVNRIMSVKDIKKFKKGEVLVTDMTDPDWVPAMKLAAAIITDSGGRTAHAAIISRELGIPCIVGTGNATKVLKTGREVTVSCAEGEIGKIYQGIIPFKIKRTDISSLKKPKVKIMMNLGEPDQAFSLSFIPNDGVGLAREEFIIANKIKIHPLALLNYRKLPFSLKKKIDKVTVEFKDKKQFFVERLAEGIAKIGAAFYPKPVILRFSDFKSNEYAELIGGEQFEPKEENPMLGWRGASRYYDSKFKSAFLLECQALKRAREKFGLKNIWAMVPFCRTVKEGEKVLKIMKEGGLEKGKNDLKVIVMAEIPSNVVLAEEFLKMFDGMSIGSNDLTQLVLGIDRDSAILREVGDERNQAVKEMVKEVIRACRQKKKYCGICGQAPSDYPEFARFLVKEGIESISLNPDTVLKTTLLITKNKSR